jgi:hypothetical protein
MPKWWSLFFLPNIPMKVLLSPRFWWGYVIPFEMSKIYLINPKVVLGYPMGDIASFFTSF